MLGMLKKHTVELSPDIYGTLTNNGIPIENQLIERSLTYADEEYIDTCETNADGKFSFTAKTIKSRLPGNVLHEPVVRQILSISHDDKELYIWYTNQHDLACPDVCRLHLSNLKAEMINKEEVFELINIELPEFPLVVKSICSL